MNPLNEAQRPHAITSAPPAILDHAAFKLRELLLYLKANPVGREIRNSRDLPSPKATLVNALRLLIASEMRAEQRQQMLRVGILLAQFQPFAPVRPVSSTKAEADPLTQWIAVVERQTRDAVENDNWMAVLAERDRLERLFTASVCVAEKMLCTQAPRRADSNRSSRFGRVH